MLVEERRQRETTVAREFVVECVSAQADTASGKHGMD